jgi:hypothetical protein
VTPSSDHFGGLDLLGETANSEGSKKLHHMLLSSTGALKYPDSKNLQQNELQQVSKVFFCSISEVFS